VHERIEPRNRIRRGLTKIRRNPTQQSPIPMTLPTAGKYPKPLIADTLQDNRRPNIMNRCLKPRKISFRTTTKYRMTIWTPIPLQKQWFFKWIKIRLDKSVTPQRCILTRRAMRRLWPDVLLTLPEKTLEIDLNRYYHPTAFRRVRFRGKKRTNFTAPGTGFYTPINPSRKPAFLFNLICTR
jgi:hypothetical protein